MKKWITGYEGLYEIDDLGVVYRHTKAGSKPSVGKQHPTGYMKIALCKQGKAKTFNVHRLVADAFLEPDDTRPFIDHIDEDKTNNNVANLRRCTAQENNTFYDTKDGRRYQKEEAKKRKAQLKQYEKDLILRTQQIVKLEKQLHDREAQLQEYANIIANQKIELEQYRKKVMGAVDEIVEQTNVTLQPYSGYIDTTGVKFRSVDDMVGVVGKPITINGQVFPSCGSAATYIVKQELLLGKVRKHATISKELRRYLQGLRLPWALYGRYEVK